MSDKFKDCLIAVLIGFMLLTNFLMLIYIVTDRREAHQAPPSTTEEDTTYATVPRLGMS